MSELTMAVVRLGMLIMLWLFVFSIVGVLRSDLYGTRVTSRPRGAAKGRKNASKRGPGLGLKAGQALRRRTQAAQLVVVEGPLKGTVLPLRERGTLIGRNAECALVLDDDYASGRHARIYHGEHGWLVEDLNSTNGTFVGHARITSPTPIDTGSTLRIGQTVVELRK